MAKKKTNSLEDLGSMVFSTGNQGFVGFDEESEEEALDPSQQLLEVHLEKKGRGGKIAVLIKGFEGSPDALKALAKEIKNHCATGGSIKNGEIIIQGPVRDKVMAFLNSEGYKTKRVGA